MTTSPTTTSAATDRPAALADAAIMVIGQNGMRALTHRAVDTAAAVPAGTTSYHFRTRRELLRGILNRIADRNAGRLEQPGPPATAPAPRNRAERIRAANTLAARCAVFVDGQLTTERTSTLARMAVEIEVASDPELREILHTGDRFRTMAIDAVGRLGSASPSADANALIAFLEGLQFDRLVGTGSLLGAPAGSNAGRSEIAAAVRAFLIGIIPEEC